MGDLLSHNQLADILALKVCSNLRATDLQALGQTCTSLRQLVSMIPATTWKAVAANSLPAAHPLLLLPGDAVQSRLEQIARAKISLPTPTTCGIWQGATSTFNSTSAVNHHGTQVILRKGSTISICQLDLEADPMSVSTIWTTDNIESTNEESVENSDAKFTWSDDDRYIACQFTVRDYDDDRAEFNENGWFDVLYLFDSVSLTFRQITHTHEIALMHSPKFAPSSKQLIVPWESFESNDTILEIYDVEGNERTASVHVPADCSFDFQPSGQHFAVSMPGGARLYDFEGNVLHTFQTASRPDVPAGLVAISPDSSQLALCHGQGGSTNIHLFPIDSGSPSHQFPGPAEEVALRFGDIIISFASLLAIKHPYGRPNEPIHMSLYSLKQDSFGRALGETVIVGYPAISPDGIFVAVMTRSEADGNHRHALCIHAMATGCCLHKYDVKGGVKNVSGDSAYLTFSLSWASSGIRLLVGIRRESYGESTEEEHLMVFSF